MEVGKKEKQENKKIKILVSLIIIVILVVTVTMIFLKRSNEEELNTSLKEMGKNFYENFYYEQIGSSSDERNALLSKFTTIGIKVDLENLGRYNDGEFSKEIKEFKNNKTGKKKDLRFLRVYDNWNTSVSYINYELLGISSINYFDI